jgi:MFS family permease
MMMAVFSAAQFISSPFWGNLSDRYGRKRILILGVIGSAISMFLMGIANSFAVVFLTRAVGGLLSSATLPTAMAYISDSTTEEERGGGMGVIGAAMGVGMVIGPGIGGLVGSEDISTPFFISTGLSV